MKNDQNHTLVTGGAGFLGSHLCDTLIEQGADVLCIDNFFSGSKDNIRHLFAHPFFELARHDVIHAFFAEVDRIFHLACPASPIHYQYNAIKTIKTSVMGTINMLGLAKRTKARILLASTSEVYGDPELHPQPETYWGHVNPIGVRVQGDLVTALRCPLRQRIAGVLCRPDHELLVVASSGDFWRWSQGEWQELPSVPGGNATIMSGDESQRPLAINNDDETYRYENGAWVQVDDGSYGRVICTWAHPDQGIFPGQLS